MNNRTVKGNPIDVSQIKDGYGVYGAERLLYNFTFYNFFEGDEPNDMCFLVVTPV